MFGNGDIGKVLEKGRTWVTDLETAIKATETKVKEKDTEIKAIQVSRDTLDSKVTEGKAVAANFKNMLGMK